MKRTVALLVATMLCVGCGRSADNAGGFDQAIKDVEQGVAPSKEVPSEEYRKGYKEVLDSVEAAKRRQQEHAADQQRAQQLHEKLPRKK